jgi:hypothetical protein
MFVNSFLGRLALPAGGLFLLLFFFVMYRNWRCPACNGFLGLSLYVPVCGRCGAPLM